jgi:uncharacterized protein (TIGR02448 family)
MNKKIGFAVIAISTLSTMAPAYGASDKLEATTMSPFATTFGPTLTTSYARKEIVAAQDDIANFVASNGKIRTARFENAMAIVRQMNNVQAAQDMELAQAVLADLN